MAFADNLKSIRKINNISQEGLAELLDVSRQAVSKWEQGLGYPEVEKLLLLSKRLNVSLDELMSDGTEAESAGARIKAAPIFTKSEKKSCDRKKTKALLLSTGLAAVLLVAAAYVWLHFPAPEEPDTALDFAGGTRYESGVVVANYSDSIVIKSDNVLYPGLGRYPSDAQLYYAFYVDENTVIENADGSKAASLFDIASGSKVEVEFSGTTDEPLAQRDGAAPHPRTDILLSSIKVQSDSKAKGSD